MALKAKKPNFYCTSTGFQGWLNSIFYIFFIASGVYLSGWEGTVGELILTPELQARFFAEFSEPNQG